MNELDQIKKLAGVAEFQGYTEYTLETSSQRANEIKEEERSKDLKPGDAEWFDLWFGQNNGLNFPAGFRGRKR